MKQPNEVEKKLYADIMKKRAKILDEFGAAYTAETGLMPSQVVLVEQHGITGDGQSITKWYFKPKEETKP